LAGVSRSATVVVAYLMTVTELSYSDALNAVKGARKIANPNFGFRRQLQNYEFTQLKTVSVTAITYKLATYIIIKILISYYQIKLT
jgi:protein-tyrosine phosphatase